MPASRRPGKRGATRNRTRGTARLDAAAVQLLYERLRAAIPAPRSELVYRTPFQLLVSVILSAQATDRSVNLATGPLFAVAGTPEAIVALGVRGLSRYIRTIGLWRMKARNVVAASRLILARHGGQVPRERDALEALPGVGRKTANVILGTWFKKNEGVVVDTHVHRLTRLLKLTKHDDPVKIERDLMKLVPRDKWTWFSHTLIQHGRQVCIARRPRCEECVLNRLCPSSRV